MELTTRCPQCGTTFSASLAQLQLRKGFIRCIHCAHIFDGYEAVVAAENPSAPPASKMTDAPPAASLPPAAPPVAGPRPASATPVGRPAETHAGRTAADRAGAPVAGEGRFTISVTPGEPAAHGRQDPEFKIGAPAARQADGPRADHEPRIGHGPRTEHEPRIDHGLRAGREARADQAPRFSQEPIHGPRIDRAVDAAGREPRVGGPSIGEPSIGGGAAPAGPIYVEPRRPAHAPAPADQSDDYLDGSATVFSSWARVFWGVLVVAGLLLLAAQALYVYRAQIANQIPSLRPMLEQACVSLACKVPYARRIDQISVTSSALRASPAAPGEAPEGASQMTLQFTLRNAYEKPQEWPTMVLDLKDFSGTLVVRKNLAPAEYLAPATLSRPFPASSELTVSLPIKLDGLKVNGYQLDKFFQ